MIPPQAKNNGLNFIFINSRFSDFHIRSILEENENESEEDDKPKNKKRNNKNNKKKKKIPFRKNKKQYNRNKKKNTLDYSNKSLGENSNLSTPKRNYKSEGNIDIIESKIFIGEKEKEKKKIIMIYFKPYLIINIKVCLKILCFNFFKFSNNFIIFYISIISI